MRLNLRFDAREALNESPDRHLRLEASERRSKAQMMSSAEGQML